MPRPVSARLDDINVRIAHIESLLADRTIDDVRKDQFAVAALERFLEVISEASRHLPDGMKILVRRSPGGGSPTSGT